MIIKILGTRGEIETSHPRHFKQSGILIDNKILLDIGEREYLKLRPKAILITHLHPDHAFFERTKTEFETDIPVYAPERSKRLKEVRILNAPLDIEGYTIRPIPTIHSLKVVSQGYIVQKANKRIFYSSDIADLERRYYPPLEHTDMVITEGSFIRKGGMIRKSKDGRKFGHAGIPDLIELFSKFTHRIVFAHFGSWFMKDVEAATKKILAIKPERVDIDIASDGKEYVV